MGSSWTLRQKFVTGLITVIVVSMIVMMGTRLLGKSALFHHLERDHLAEVMQASALLDQVIAGSRTDVAPATLLAPLDKAHAIASRVDVELFAIEQGVFRMMGFGGVIDLPHKDMVDLARIRDRLRSAPSPLTAEFARTLRADMDEAIANSDAFGPLVAEAVGVVKAIVITINTLGIAALLGSFWVIRQATLSPLQEALETARRIASGDLSGRVHVHARDEMGQLMQALADMQESLASVVRDVRQRTEAVATSMNEVASGQGDLSQRTEQQASTIQQTAASVEQLTQSVRQSVDRAHDADQHAAQAATVARQGGELVGQVVHSMDEILGASRKISDIISVIDGIAFQTNILALNAAVEAARAGEQGRGFAVVASEVRSLAQRSASAAKEIASLINNSVDKVESGSTLVTRAGDTIQQVVSSVQGVSALISEVNAALVEQSTGIALIDEAMVQLDQATQQNAALAEQSAAVVESVRHESQALVGAVGQFRVG